MFLNRKNFFFLMVCFIFCLFFNLSEVRAYYNFTKTCDSAGPGRVNAFFVKFNNIEFDGHGDPVGSGQEFCFSVDQNEKDKIFLPPIVELRLKKEMFFNVNTRLQGEVKNLPTGIRLMKFDRSTPDYRRLYYNVSSNPGGDYYLFFMGFEGENVQVPEINVEDYMCCIEESLIDGTVNSCLSLSSARDCSGSHTVKKYDPRDPGVVIEEKTYYKRAAKCVEIKECLDPGVISKVIPIYKNIINWNGSNNVYVSSGDEKVTIELSAINKEDNTNNVEISCINCKPEELYLKEKSNGKLKLEFYISKYENHAKIKEYPASFEMAFIGKVAQGYIDRYSMIVHINKFDCTQFNNDAGACNSNNNCFYWTEKTRCVYVGDSNVCNEKLPYSYCGPTCSNVGGCAQKCSWNQELKQCLSPVKDYRYDDYAEERERGAISGILPACAFSGDCDDINDILDVGLKAVKKIFGFLGGMALLMFIYGGFTMITSMGNSEKSKKGTQILVAAVTGMVIVFSAYLLIGFLLDALMVEEGLRGITLK